MNSLSKLALRYHDRSVLEQHHIAVTMKLLSKRENNFLESLSDQKFKEFRKMMISNILATDMSEHFKLLKSVEARQKECIEESKYFGSCEEDLKLLGGMIMHTADFGGAAKKFSLSKIWSERVNKEFQ